VPAGSIPIMRLLVVLVVVCALPGLVRGAERTAREKPMPRTREVQAVRERAFRHLNRAHKALADGDYAACRTALDKLQRDDEKLNDHERALMWQSYGYLHAAQEQYPAAVRAFERSLAGDGLPDAARRDARYNLAQLYLLQERYDDAIAMLTAWLEGADGSSPAAHFMLAMAYMQKGQSGEALPHARRAVAEAATPQESWLQLLLSLLLEQERYREALPVLEQLVARFPRKSYWMQLSAVHSELGNYRKALGALELAYVQNMLTADRELRTLAQLYLHNEVPYKAAKVLEQGLTEGTIPGDADAWELLADAWLLARERERAQAPLERAAELSESGRVYLRLAHVYLDREEWKSARAALAAALEKGRLEDPGDVHLLLGITNASEERWDEARRAFEAAERHPKTKEAAAQWLASIDAEVAAETREEVLGGNRAGANMPDPPDPSATRSN
jgi:tetratricopeptide (TPR) repeat protein